MDDVGLAVRDRRASKRIFCACNHTPAFNKEQIRRPITIYIASKLLRLTYGVIQTTQDFV
ncbi:MAG: hypothetical protein AUK47_27710 [Deltaproteobacteria bacterium CG2_30_63_29]|nr:MAG: hypothetical protein AUK47_27710 [Deltaproteobacteria bacterium CG2_30_63_29]